jgi:preprotein translocase subunit SecD
MNTLFVALAGIAGLFATIYVAVWAAVRMAEEKGRQEGESGLRKAQEEDARRRLENALAADAKSRVESANGGLLNNDGHRRD